MTMVVIPSRLQSTRLPSKPLARLGNGCLVTQCWHRAIEANVGPVYVATDSFEIKAVAEAVGAATLMTDPLLPSGTDRVQAVAKRLDPEGYHDIVINVQGDLPFVSADIIRAVAKAAEDNPDVDMVTPIHTAEHVVASEHPNGWDFKRVTLSRHIGIYAWRRKALDRYVTLPVSKREQEQRLEQLRAVDAGMRVLCIPVHTFPFEINTPSDLEEVRQLEDHLNAGRKSLG